MVHLISMPNTAGQEKNLQVLFSGDTFHAAQTTLFEACAELADSETCLVGIRSGGDVLADRLADHIESQTGTRPPVGYLDISLYRDDFAHRSHWPSIQESNIPFEIENRQILLVDEVLFTGRTIRAALEALNEFGRPARVQLGVLFDRGHRELPIQPDCTGLKVDLPRESLLLVEFGKPDTGDRALSLAKEIG